MTEGEAEGNVPRGAGERPTVLVTGATGFLGSHLATALLERGYRVRALSRRTSGDDPTRSVLLSPIAPRARREPAVHHPETGG